MNKTYYNSEPIEFHTLFQGISLNSGTCAFVNVFVSEPDTRSLEVKINDQKIARNQFKVEGSNLVLLLSNLPYGIDNGDEITVIYSVV